MRCVESRRVSRSVEQEVFRPKGVSRSGKATQPLQYSGAGDDVRSPGAVVRALVQVCKMPPTVRLSRTEGKQNEESCRAVLKIIAFEPENPAKKSTYE